MLPAADSEGLRWLIGFKGLICLTTAAAAEQTILHDLPRSELHYVVLAGVPVWLCFRLLILGMFRYFGPPPEAN